VRVPTVCCQGQITLHNLILSPAVKMNSC
jgi:hypothetical protein